MAIRKRRSADEARAEILEVAERRLAEHGLEGLNVVDVAREAGMSHATLIHHFGNTEDMRRALINRMTNRLLRDVIDVLQAEQTLNVEVLMRDLFAALSQGGHAKLLAWMAVGEKSLTGTLRPSDEVYELFAELIPVLARHLPARESAEQAARRLVYLVATSAIGYGISGATLANVVGLDAEDEVGFPEWLGAQVRTLLKANQLD